MEAVSTAYIMFLIISHMTVSSTMLILNKAVLVYLPVATSVLLAQVGSSAIILWVLGKIKVLSVDGFELKTAQAFFWNAVAFTIALFTNFKALESANVETIIVFRTLSIFATAYGDFRLLDGRVPSLATIGTLCLVVLGAVGYVQSDKGFEIRSMGWVFAYGAANAAYPIVTKLVIKSNSLTAWGRTYYNNLMTFIVLVPVALVLGDVPHLMELGTGGGLNMWSVGLLVLSCVWGTAISFLGFLVLENVSATTFNVMGNANKILTLVINHVLWENHASIQANLFLFLSLVGAALYGEVKRREAPPPPDRRNSGAAAAAADADTNEKPDAGGGGGGGLASKV